LLQIGMYFYILLQTNGDLLHTLFLLLHACVQNATVTHFSMFCCNQISICCICFLLLHGCILKCLQYFFAAFIDHKEKMLLKMAICETFLPYDRTRRIC
jgi:hypothetical protein